MIDIRFQQQQLIAILKFLEYSGYYTKFQDTILQKFYDNDFSKTESEAYIDAYVKYRLHLDDFKNKRAKKYSETYQKVLEKFEDSDGNSYHSYEKIAAIRNMAFSKYLVEKAKLKEMDEINKKVEEYGKSKQGVMNSVKSFFGFSNNDKKKEIQEDIRHYQAELDKDFFDKYSIEEQKLEQEIEEFLNNKSTFDDEMIQKMPAEWLKTITVLSVNGLYSDVSLSRYEQSVEVGLRDGSITVGASKSQYMFETVSTDENKNGIEVKLVNRREEIPVTLTAATHAEFYIFLDVPTLKEIEMFFTAHLKHNKIDISYYLEQAKIKFLKYINLGLDYVETMDMQNIQTVKADVSVSLSSPIIFIRDPRPHINKWILFNLGKVVISTEMVESSQEIDSKVVTFSKDSN